MQNWVNWNQITKKLNTLIKGLICVRPLAVLTINNRVWWSWVVLPRRYKYNSSKDLSLIPSLHPGSGLNCSHNSSLLQAGHWEYKGHLCNWICGSMQLDHVGLAWCPELYNAMSLVDDHTKPGFCQNFECESGCN